MPSTSSAALSRDRSGPAAKPGFSRTDLALIAVALVWGGNFAVVKFGAQQFAPLAFSATRIGLATVLLLAAARVLREPMPSPAEVRALLGLGVIGNGIYQVLFVTAVSVTRSANVAIVMASTPAIMALVGRVRGTEMLTPRALLGVAVSMGGIALVVLGGAAGDAPGGSVAGDLLALCAVGCWVAYTMLLRPYTDRVAPVTLSALTMTGGAIPLALVAMPELSRVPWGAMSASAWTALLYSSVLAIAFGYLAWYRGIRVLGPTRTAMYSNLQPIVALAVGALLMHEPPTIWQVLGAAGTMAGLLLVRA
jgi:drug/metabolite transporter (DMT)-like permease